MLNTCRLNRGTEKPTLLLVSLRSGHVGIDMTFATDLFFLDRWWNSSSELQMESRADRFVSAEQFNLSEYVNIHFYNIRGSVEEYQLWVQSQKNKEELRLLGRGLEHQQTIGEEDTERLTLFRMMERFFNPYLL